MKLALLDQKNTKFLTALGKIWPCGHHRSEATTQRVGNVTRCRVCRRRRWRVGFMISLARIKASKADLIRHEKAKLHHKQLKGAERQHSIFTVLHHPANGRLPLDTLKSEVAKIFEISVADLTGKARNRPLVWARAVISKILFERDLSYPTIGRVMGGRDHSTIINQVSKFDIYERLDPRVTEAYLLLRDREASHG